MSTLLFHEIPRNLVKYDFWQVCESVLDEISVLVGRLCVRAQLLGLVWLFVAPQTSSPSSSVHWIFQARILEWAAVSYSRGSFQPRDGTRISCVSCLSKWILYRLGSLKVDLFFLPSVGKANIIQSTEGLNRTKGWRKEKLSLSLPQAGLDIILLLPLDCDFHHWHSLLSGLSAQAEIYAVGFPGFSACRLWVVGFLSLQITQANSS